MIQFDMTGYYRPGTSRIISITTDYTTSALNDFLRQIVKAYTTTPWEDHPCGYACSDHGSFYKAGFATCYPFEAAVVNENKQIHTVNDILSRLDLTHAAEFVRIAVGWAVEMSY